MERIKNKQKGRVGNHKKVGKCIRFSKNNLDFESALIAKRKCKLNRRKEVLLTCRAL